MISKTVIIIHAVYRTQVNGVRYVCRNFFAGTYRVENISLEFHKRGPLVGIFVRTICHGAVIVRRFLLFLA